MVISGLSLVEAKSLFIDRALMERKIDQATAVTFRKVGGRTRLRAKSLIRKAPKKARKSTGKRSPYNRTGLLKKFIFFALDQQSNSVVTGPVKLDGKGSGSVPLLLEDGGMQMVNGKRANYQPFPYMKPAFDYALTGLPGDVAGSFK